MDPQTDVSNAPEDDTTATNDALDAADTAPFNDVARDKQFFTKLANPPPELQTLVLRSLGEIDLCPSEDNIRRHATDHSWLFSQHKVSATDGRLDSLSIDKD